MKKRITGILLCLCMVMTLLPATAWAADTHTSHPVCGASHSDVGDHTTGTCERIDWAEFSTDLINDDVLPAGSYYLTADVTLGTPVKIEEGKVNLCLNGHKLIFSSTITVNAYNSPATLNICDCGDDGELEWKGNTSSTSTRNGIDISNAGKLNLYGGTIRNTGRYGETVKLTSHNQQTGTTTFNMYGGKVCHEPTSSSSSFDGVIHVYDRKCAINIYGGDVSTNESSNRSAIYADSGTNSDSTNMTTVLIAGGNIKGGGYGLWLGAQGHPVQLTLDGSPTITCAADGDSGISLADDGHDPILVRSGFSPTGTISVSHFDGVGVFAKSEEGGSLEDYAQYFVSAQEGYFVESNTNGDLRLTACEIENQPSEDNGYTVTANGSPAYQWYPTTPGTVTVNTDNATACGDAHYMSWNGYWSYDNSNDESVTQEFFTIDLREGDELVLGFRVEPGTTINGVSISSGKNTVSGIQERPTTYTLTAPADGTYTLSVSASLRDEGEEDRLAISFAATVTDDVPDETALLRGQTNKTLSTDGLESGSYICQVTWEGKTRRYSDAVYYGTEQTPPATPTPTPTPTPAPTPGGGGGSGSGTGGSAPVITGSAGDQGAFAYPGEPATLSIDVEGADSYQWYIDRRDGRGFVPIPGATGPSYTTSAVAPENDGYQYYCVASNANGSVASPIFTLNVAEYLEIPKTGDNSRTGLPIGLMMLGLAGMGFSAFMMYKRKRES